jgi:hypothetical protein
VDAHYPTDEAPATPEYVLEVLRESVRLQVGWDLTFDSSVGELLGAYNDLAWPTIDLLARCMDNTFGVEIPTREWERGLRRVRSRTVRHVCEFLAPRLTRPLIRPWRHIGGECRSAGVFLTVRAILAGRGLDPATLTPSAPLLVVPYRHLDFLFWRLSLIAPGWLPPPRERGTILGHHLLGCLSGLWLLFGSVLGCVALGLAAADGRALGMAVGAVMLFTAAACGRVLWRVQHPPFVRTEWGEFRTFRDLAYTLAGQQPRRRIQPSA